jgi:hypothetical protein
LAEVFPQSHKIALSRTQVKNQLGQATDKPTLRWIFKVLQGIHLVKINAQSQISHLTEEILDILQYFSIYFQNYYRVS